ncbi:hypothetical protein BDN70DRAFT_933912 [Pholiota conissans]|uniref:Uncharacterized protein n=1 Tax=Pholiota conissans TaxID=109636 RepID=A0A9P5Z1K4_9AGAR|nr:hypothetical protein BDN70DRAFT_933912 [Pholiota conissans]
MSSDPRVHKPRLPKAYSDQQLAFLKSSLPEFERRSQGSIRGDAKKFALERAQDFIVRFGLPDEFVGVEEPESRFKEQIYNWFKNTVGRTRRKLEGRPRSAKKAAEKASKHAHAHAASSSSAVVGGSEGPSGSGGSGHPRMTMMHHPGAAAALAGDHQMSWSAAGVGAAPNIVPYAEGSSTSSPVNSNQTLIPPIQYGGLQPSSSMSTALSTPTTTHATAHSASHAPAHPSAHAPSHAQPHPSAHSSAAAHAATTHASAHAPQQQQQQHPQHSTPTQHLSTLTLTITRNTLRESFLQGLDASTLANMVQSFVASHPSPTPLTPVVDALFDAISAEAPPGAFARDPHPYLRRFLDASAYFSGSIVHAGVPGPLAGPRALQMQIRKYSTWTPSAPPRSAFNSTSNSSSAGGGSGTPQSAQQRPSTTASNSSTSLSDEMQRIATDRQRRKDHIQWARIHAAALELGMLSMGRVGENDNSGYAYAMGRAFSEMMARDAVWEADEVEWVAGICVLRAVIRTAMRGDRRQRDEYDELLRTYEGRWKEIKDEARQAVVTEVLLSAKDDLARLDDSLS